MGVYVSDSTTKYINFYDIIKEKRAKYPFAILNTDRENKPGRHWWSFLDIHPKKDLLLFDIFGFVGFKQFIVDNDKNIIDKILFNLEKVDKKDTKINLISLTFSIGSYKKIKEKSLDNLTDTAKDFFHLLSEFGKSFKSLQQARVEYFNYIFRRICKIIDDEFLTKKKKKKKQQQHCLMRFFQQKKKQMRKK